MNTLTIKQLNINFGANLILNNINMKLIGGKIYALVGDNGSGKTTLLKCLAGLIKIPKNTIFIDEIDISLLNVKEKSKNISFVLQHSPFDPFTNGFERILHGLIPHEELSISGQEEKILHLAKRFNIEHLLTKRLMHMSGGEQRLIYLAKSFISDKIPIFLLDEPTVFLDFSRKNELIKIIKELSLRGSLVIFSSHDQAFIDELAHQVWII